MKEDLILREINFTAVTSGGPGGQHANKVSSKVRLTFDIDQSQALSEPEKIALRNKLSSKLSKNHQLILTSDQSRSQHKNREIVSERFLKLLKRTLKPAQKRIKTKPTRSSKLKRLDQKKKAAQKKELRRKPKFD